MSKWRAPWVVFSAALMTVAAVASSLRLQYFQAALARNPAYDSTLYEFAACMPVACYAACAMYMVLLHDSSAYEDLNVPAALRICFCVALAATWVSEHLSTLDNSNPSKRRMLSWTASTSALLSCVTFICTHGEMQPERRRPTRRFSHSDCPGV